MPYPVGISIGHTYLTSAYYTDADELIPIARIVANNEWQTFFSQTWGTDDDRLNPPSVNKSEVVSLFRATLQQIKNATEEILNKTVDINSIAIPAHFHSLSRTLRQAAVEEGLITVYQQAIHSLDADRLAYDLDSCSGFKLPPNETCDVEDLNLVLVFNYEPERLSVAMVEVGLYICSPHNFEHYLQFGEMNGSILDPARQQELSRILKHYLEVVSKEREKQWHTPDVLQYLRAVVLSGEASDAGMQEMRFALVTALPEYQDKFRMSLDPHFVGTFGAAQMARHVVQNPEFMRPQQDFVVPDEYVHEELRAVFWSCCSIEIS